MKHYLEDRSELHAAHNHLRSPVLKQPYGRRVEFRGRLHPEKLGL